MDFKHVRKTRKKGNCHAPSFDKTVQEYRTTIHASAMFNDLCETLQRYKEQIMRIRCLALGEFYSDFPAKYQLALLLELLEFLESDRDQKILVSIYDPVFGKDEKTFIEKMGSNWSIDESITGDDNVHLMHTLFYLPHAPLDLTDTVLLREKPSLLLANNIIEHTSRYTKSELFQKYPALSRLINSLENTDSANKGSVQNVISSTGTLGDTNSDGDNFTTYTPKRRRRKNKSKFLFQEPEIDYGSIDTWFRSCELLTTFENGALLKDKPWANSFSDMSLHLIE